MALVPIPEGPDSVGGVRDDDLIGDLVDGGEQVVDEPDGDENAREFPRFRQPKSLLHKGISRVGVDGLEPPTSSLKGKDRRLSGAPTVLADSADSFVVQGFSAHIDSCCHVSVLVDSRTRRGPNAGIVSPVRPVRPVRPVLLIDALDFRSMPRSRFGRSSLEAGSRDHRHQSFCGSVADVQ